MDEIISDAFEALEVEPGQQLSCRCSQVQLIALQTTCHVNDFSTNQSCIITTCDVKYVHDLLHFLHSLLSEVFVVRCVCNSL